MIIKIPAPLSAMRFTDFLTEFPNGILNKVQTGVGGTYLCLTNPEPYIVASPTVELIQNKCHQHKNVFGVFGDISFSEFKHYMKDAIVPKIMVTYNSLPKLVNWLKTMGNPYKEYKILIDEYHTLLSDYSYRDEAIDGLLEESLKFDHKCFLSATPIQPNYCPPQLKDLDNYEIVWQNTSKIIPIRKKTNKPFAAVVNIIKQYKAADYKLEVDVKGKIEISEEAYFFINSVKAISDIIDNAGLLNSEVKVICSDNLRNRDILGDISISKASDDNKPFTFVTSKSFVGTDFYSKTGITYIVSNVNKSNTLLDIATECFQIAGRIRNVENPFKNRIYHIYNTGARELSRQEFDKVVEDKINETKLQMSGFNRMLPEEQKAYLKRMSKDDDSDYTYYNKKTNQLEFNELKRLNEDFEYNIVYETYTNGLSVRESYMKAGFDLTDAQKWEKIEEDFIDTLTTLQFRDIIKEYVDIIDCKNCEDCTHDDMRLKHLECLEPEIKDIIVQIGTSKVRSLKYNLKRINQHLYSGSNEVTNAIKARLDITIEKNKIYPSSEIKTMLQGIYNNLKIDKKAKATDLTEFYTIDKKNRGINGKVQDSVIIL